MDGFIISERIYNSQENHYFIGAIAIVFLALLVIWVSSSLRSVNRNLYAEAYRSRYIQLTRLNTQEDDEPLPPYEGPKDDDAPPEVIFSIEGDEDEEDNPIQGAEGAEFLDALETDDDEERYDVFDDDEVRPSEAGQMETHHRTIV